MYGVDAQIICAGDVDCMSGSHVCCIVFAGGEDHSVFAAGQSVAIQYHCVISLAVSTNNDGLGSVDGRTGNLQFGFNLTVSTDTVAISSDGCVGDLDVGGSTSGDTVLHVGSIQTTDCDAVGAVSLEHGVQAVSLDILNSDVEALADTHCDCGVDSCTGSGEGGIHNGHIVCVTLSGCGGVGIDEVVACLGGLELEVLQSQGFFTGVAGCAVDGDGAGVDLVVTVDDNVHALGLLDSHVLIGVSQQSDGVVTCDASIDCFLQGLVLSFANLSHIVLSSQLISAVCVDKVVIRLGGSNIATLVCSQDCIGSGQDDGAIVGQSACNLSFTSNVHGALFSNQELLGGLEGGGCVDVHDTDGLVAQTHTVVVVDNDLGAIGQVQSCGSICTGLSLTCGTAANCKAVLHGQSGSVHVDGALVDQVIQFDGGVLDHQSAVVLVVGILLAAGNMDAVRSRVGSRGQVCVIKDNSTIALAAAANKQEALAPVNGSSTADGNSLAVNRAVHSDGSVANQFDGCIVHCCCQSISQGLVANLADHSNVDLLNDLELVAILDSLVILSDVSGGILVEGTTDNGQGAIACQSLVLAAGEGAALDGDGCTSLNIHSRAAVSLGALRTNEGTVLDGDVCVAGNVHRMIGALIGTDDLVFAAIDGSVHIAVNTQSMALGLNVDIGQSQLACIDFQCADGLVSVLDGTVQNSHLGIGSQDAAVQGIAHHVQGELCACGNGDLTIQHDIASQVDSVAVLSCFDRISQRSVGHAVDRSNISSLNDELLVNLVVIGLVTCCQHCILRALSVSTAGDEASQVSAVLGLFVVDDLVYMAAGDGCLELRAGLQIQSANSAAGDCNGSHDILCVAAGGVLHPDGADIASFDGDAVSLGFAVCELADAIVVVGTRYGDLGVALDGQNSVIAGGVVVNTVADLQLGVCRSIYDLDTVNDQRAGVGNCVDCTGGTVQSVIAHNLTIGNGQDAIVTDDFVCGCSSGRTGDGLTVQIQSDAGGSSAAEGRCCCGDHQSLGQSDIIEHRNGLASISLIDCLLQGLVVTDDSAVLISECCCKFSNALLSGRCIVYGNLVEVSCPIFINPNEVDRIGNNAGDVNIGSSDVSACHGGNQNGSLLSGGELSALNLQGDGFGFVDVLISDLDAAAAVGSSDAAALDSDILAISFDPQTVVFVSLVDSNILQSCVSGNSDGVVDGDIVHLHGSREDDCVGVPSTGGCALTGLVDGHVLQSQSALSVLQANGSPVAVGLIQSQGVHALTIDDDVGGSVTTVYITCTVIQSCISNQLDAGVVLNICQCSCQGLVVGAADLGNILQRLVIDLDVVLAAGIVAVEQSCHAGAVGHLRVGNSNVRTGNSDIQLIASLEGRAFNDQGISVGALTSIAALMEGRILQGDQINVATVGNPTGDVGILNQQGAAVAAIEVDSEVGSIDDRILNSDIALSIAVLHAVVAGQLDAVQDNILTVHIQSAVIGAGLFVMNVQVLNGCAGSNGNTAGDVDQVLALSIGLTCNSDSLVDSQILGVGTCNDGNSFASHSCLHCSIDRSVTGLADVSNEGNGSQDGLVVHNNSDVIVGIGVIALLVVPQAVAGNVAVAEAGSSGVGNIQGDAAGQAGVHFDCSLAVNSSGCIEDGVSDSDIVGNVCTFSVDQHGLTSGVEDTFVECNFLCTVGPNVVVVGVSGVENTVVEGLALAVQEYLTIEGTVVVNQIAGVLQTLVKRVICVGEGDIVEGHACAAHVVSTNIGEFNASNSTGNGDVLAGEAGLVGAGNQDANFAAVLDACKCSIHGGVVLDLAVCVSSCSIDLVQVIGAVELNIIGSDSLAVDHHDDLIGSHADVGVALCPCNSPVLVIGAREGDVPGDVDIAVDDAANVVQGCGGDHGFALVQLDDQALKSVAAALAPDGVCANISGSNGALELTVNQNDLALGVLSDSQLGRIVAGDHDLAGECNGIAVEQHIANTLTGCVEVQHRGISTMEAQDVDNSVGAQSHSTILDVQGLTIAVGLLDLAIDGCGCVGEVDGSIAGAAIDIQISVNGVGTALEDHAPDTAAGVAAGQINGTAIQDVVLAEFNTIGGIDSGAILNGDSAADTGRGTLQVCALETTVEGGAAQQTEGLVGRSLDVGVVHHDAVICTDCIAGAGGILDLEGVLTVQEHQVIIVQLGSLDSGIGDVHSTLISQGAGNLHIAAVDIHGALCGNQEALGGFEGGITGDVHNADGLVAQAHAVMVVDDQLGTVVQADGSGCILAGLGLGCGTAAHCEAILNGQGAAIHGDGALVDQIIQLNVGVLNDQSAVVLVVGILLTAGDMDTSGCIVGCGSQVCVLEDNGTVTLAAAANKQEALAPVNGSSTADGNRLAIDSAVHGNGSVALCINQSDNIAILCSSQSVCNSSVVFVANMSDLTVSNMLHVDAVGLHDVFHLVIVGDFDGAGEAGHVGLDHLNTGDLVVQCGCVDDDLACAIEFLGGDQAVDVSVDGASILDPLIGVQLGAVDIQAGACADGQAANFVGGVDLDVSTVLQSQAIATPLDDHNGILHIGIGVERAVGSAAVNDDVATAEVLDHTIQLGARIDGGSTVVDEAVCLSNGLHNRVVGQLDVALKDVLTGHNNVHAIKHEGATVGTGTGLDGINVVDRGRISLLEGHAVECRLGIQVESVFQSQSRGLGGLTEQGDGHVGHASFLCCSQSVSNSIEVLVADHSQLAIGRIDNNTVVTVLACLDHVAVNQVCGHIIGEGTAADGLDTLSDGNRAVEGAAADDCGIGGAANGQCAIGSTNEGTAGDGDVLCTGSGSAVVPQTAVDLAALNGNGAAVGTVIAVTISVNCNGGSVGDDAALDGQVGIAAPGVVVDSVSAITSGRVILNGTALNGQGTKVQDGGMDLAGANLLSTAVRQSELTAADGVGDGQVTVVADRQNIVLCLIGTLDRNGLAIQIQGHLLASCNADRSAVCMVSRVFGGQDNCFHICQHLDSLAVGCCNSVSQSSVEGVINLGSSLVNDFFQDTLDIFLSASDGQSDIFLVRAGGVLINSQAQRTTIGDVGIAAELIVSKHAALDLGINQAQRCTVVALDGDLDAVHAALNGAVGSSAAGSGDQHTGALGIDVDLIHGTDDVLSCVAAVVSLDTIGQSCALDGHILDGTNAGSGAGLQNNTADGLVCIALALYINNQVLECGSIPNLDGSGVACVNNGTILDGGIVLHAHAAVCVTGGQGLAAQIQSDGLGNGQLLITVVDVCGHDDGIAILSCCQCCVQFSLGSDLDGRMLGTKLSLSINGLCVDVVLGAAGQGVALCLNVQNIVCCVGTQINFAGSNVIIEDNAFGSAHINVSLQSITSNNSGLNVLAAFVVRNCSSSTGQGRILDNNFCRRQVSCRGTLAEDNAVLCAADNGQAVNSQALLSGDHSLCAGSFTDVNGQILNGCVFFESENSVPVAIANGTGELDGVAVTINSYSFLELGVRTAGSVVSAVPLTIDSDISQNLDGAAGSCSLECVNHSCVVSIADLSNVLDCLAVQLNNRIGVDIDNILHVAVNVGTVVNSDLSALDSVDTILVLVIGVDVRNVEGTILDDCVEVGTDQTIGAVALEGTAIEDTACGRTTHSCPADDGTILVQQGSTLGDAIKVQCVNAGCFEGHILEDQIALGISPALCVAALDVQVLQGQILQSTGEVALEQNLAHTLDGDASLHGRHCIGASHNLNGITSLCSSDCSIHAVIGSLADHGNTHLSDIGTILIADIATVIGGNGQICRTGQGCALSQLEGTTGNDSLFNGHGAANVVSNTCNCRIEVLNLGIAGKLDIVTTAGNSDIAAIAIAPSHVGAVNGDILQNELRCIDVEHPNNRSTLSDLNGTVLEDHIGSDLRTDLEAGGVGTLGTGTCGNGIGMAVQVEDHIIFHEAHTCTAGILQQLDGCAFQSGTVGGVGNCLQHIVEQLNSTVGVGNLDEGFLDIKGTSVLDHHAACFHVSGRICIEVTAGDIQLSLFFGQVIQNPCIHAAAESTVGNIDDSGTCKAALILIALSSQNIQVAVVANGAVGVGDPLAALDVDGAAGGHGNEAALIALAVAAVDIDSTHAASTNQAAEVTGSTVHVKLSVIENVDGRCNSLNTQIAVLTDDLGASLNVQDCATSDLNGGTPSIIVLDNNILGIDGNGLSAGAGSADCAVSSSTSIDGAVLQSDGVGLGAVVLEVQQVIVDRAVMTDGVATQVNGEGLVANVVQTVVPGVAVMSTVGFGEGLILNQSDGFTVGNCSNCCNQSLIADFADLGHSLSIGSLDSVSAEVLGLNLNILCVVLVLDCIDAHEVTLVVHLCFICSKASGNRQTESDGSSGLNLGIALHGCNFINDLGRSCIASQLHICQIDHQFRALGNILRSVVVESYTILDLVNDLLNSISCHSLIVLDNFVNDFFGCLNIGAHINRDVTAGACHRCNLIEHAIGCSSTIVEVVIGVIGLLLHGRILSRNFLDNLRSDYIVAFAININTSVKVTLGRANGELVTVQSRTILIGQLQELTAADQRIGRGVHRDLQSTVKGTAVELEQCAVSIDGAVELATMELELRTVGSVTTAVIYNIGAIKYTIVEADNGAVLNTALAGGLDNSLAGSGNAAGVGSVSLDVQSVASRSSAVVHDLDCVLVLGCGHGVGTQIQNVILIGIQLDHIGQGYIRQQGQSGAVGPVCDCLVDGGILSIANLRNGLIAHNCDEILAFSFRLRRSRCLGLGRSGCLRLTLCNGSYVVFVLGAALVYAVFQRFACFIHEDMLTSSGSYLRRGHFATLVASDNRRAIHGAGSSINYHCSVTVGTAATICCEDICRHHTDDHDKAQQQTQKSFEFLHDSFFHPFFIVFDLGVYVVSRGVTELRPSE